MVKKTVRIYLYHPSSHPVINNRVNSILKINDDLLDMKELKLKLDNRSIAVSLFLELNMIFKLLFNKKGIIHIFDFSFIFPFFIPILKLRVHKIIYDTGNIHSETLTLLGKNKLILTLARKSEVKMLKSADKVISRGVFLSSRLKKFCNINDEISYIPDPVDVSAFIKSTSNEIDLPFNANDFVIGYTANFQNIMLPYLGALPRGWEIINVLSMFKKDGVPNVRALFIGSGNGIENLIKYSKEHGVYSDCYFYGFSPQSEYIKLLKRIDIGFMEDYDLPAYKSSVGAKVQDYMSAAKVVITGKTDEREFLLEAQKDLDLLFLPLATDSDNPENHYIQEMYEKFVKVINNKKSVIHYGQLNQERAQQLFDLPIFMNQIQSLYTSLTEISE